MPTPSHVLERDPSTVGTAGTVLAGQRAPALPRTSRPTFGVEPGSGAGDNGSHGSECRARTVPTGDASQDEPRSGRTAHDVDSPPSTRATPRGDSPACGGQHRLLHAS